MPTLLQQSLAYHPVSPGILEECSASTYLFITLLILGIVSNLLKSKIYQNEKDCTYFSLNGPPVTGGGGTPPNKNRNKAFRGSPNFDVFIKQHICGICTETFFGHMTSFWCMTSSSFDDFPIKYLIFETITLLKPLLILVMNRNFHGYSSVKSIKTNFLLEKWRYFEDFSLKWRHFGQKWRHMEK